MTLFELSPIAQQWKLFHWSHLIEILFFAALFYYFSLWLRRDRQKNLLFSFYAYCAVTFLAYAFNLTAISSFLFLFAPVTIMLFILLHQDTLQKNFVTVRTITPARMLNTEWLPILMQSLLVAINNNKMAICVIEKNDALKTLLSSPLTFNAPIQKELLDILLASTAFESTKMIWVNHHGQLLAMNATWQSLVDEPWVTEDVQQLDAWKQDAVLLTNKTDALVFGMHPATRTFTIIAQKKIVEGIQTSEAVMIIKQYLVGKSPEPSYRGSYEAHVQKPAGNQPRS